MSARQPDTDVEAIRALRRAGDHERARQQAVVAAARRPQDAVLRYEAACVHDYLGREADAVPYYEAAIASDMLPDDLLRSAFVGLGSTYRALGRYALAEQTLRRGLARFADAAEMQAFLAMALHNLGRSKEAVELLLRVLAESSRDPHVQAYREAILFYAGDVERAWPA